MRHEGTLVGLLAASLLVAGLVAVPAGQALVPTHYVIYEGPMEEAIDPLLPPGCLLVVITGWPPQPVLNPHCLGSESSPPADEEDTTPSSNSTAPADSNDTEPEP